MTIALGTPASAVNVDGTPAAVNVTCAQGEAIYVVVTVSTASAHSITVTDDQSSTYVEVGSTVVDTTNLQEVRHFRAVNRPSGTYAVTATIGNPIAGQTYAGIWAVNVEDCSSNPVVADGPGQTQANPGSGTDAITSGTAQTPSAYAALIVAISMNTSTGFNLPDVGTGFGSEDATWDFGLGGNSMRAESKRITSGNAQGLFTAISGHGGDSYITQMIVFQEAPPADTLFFGSGTVS